MLIQGKFIKVGLAVVIATASMLFSITSNASVDEGEGKSEKANNSEELVYTLGAGDKIRLTVFGEEDLSGEYEVDGTGVVSIPLINDVKVSSLSVREAETLIAEKFSNGYLNNPKISIEVLNFRPFFILGEVNKPGSYPYVNGLTVINAVAMAGGYTYRAKTSKIMIKRASVNEGDEFSAQEGEKVFPGDVIRVLERFF